MPPPCMKEIKRSADASEVLEMKVGGGYQGLLKFHMASQGLVRPYDEECCLTTPFLKLKWISKA